MSATAGSDARAVLTAPPPAAARALLGAELGGQGVVVRITEVEAYGGADDAGSHAFRGPTRRNAVMFGPPGRLYCYLSYGMHVCANVACGPDGEAGAVLIRAGEVVTGLDRARERRETSRSDRDLAQGPGRLCRALGWDLRHDGADLLDPDADGPWLRLGPLDASVPVECGPRVGLRGAADRPWRYRIGGDQTVSTYRRHPRGEPDQAPAGA